MAKLRIAYVPEHFSTPLAFAQQHFGLDAELVPEPLGTGALTARLKSDNEDGVDVAIGLTEGFVADLGKAKAAGIETGYGLVGTYVESPLCWAISTGAKRHEVTGVDGLKGTTVGVSRIGSGSYVMSYVLADQRGWLDGAKEDPFGVEVIGDFAALRKSVTDKTSDFFMWEHFTTKHFWDNGELKRIGEIYTPWPSWTIAARHTAKDDVKSMMAKINQGVKYYMEHTEEAIQHITTAMHYSEADAKEWMKTVRFADDVIGMNPKMIDDTVASLQKAGVLKSDSGGSEHMVVIQRST
ncbi:Hypothetical protein R9X50_00678700 [Acrodontium crateriforme]|uniref:Ca3427-like PBP 2 domain-containing protein n=1 Tax=Acrodontium crateriforme TaxID=150365 RepID=A0AAQ3M930_9PEZI|nr:Hypothetical protein R9X50_00678700 [Acrodontium crateriforme]